MFRTILVPLDGSPVGEQALAAAARLARAVHATVHLVHVHYPNSLTPIVIETLPIIDAELQSLATQHEQFYLEQIAAAPVMQGIHTVTTLLEGEIAETLAAHAQAIQANLIVMTTHGWSGFEHFWLGSVAESLLRMTHTPLWLMRPGEPAQRAAQPLRRILVPLDGSALSEQVLPHAQALASLDGARLILARVMARRRRSDEPSDAEQKQQIEAYLQEIANRLEAQGVPADIAVGAAEQPARALLTLSRELQVDAIALATRGQGGWQRIMVGSTADKVIRASPIPVLAVRP
ncbi:universal stress protein UspA [Chloroflexus islandicus]|uniref:Universal stress protein UspA n=1 Tax=Chloroflexus islandicus TaxID=1707952 RepID=A0A178MEI0_9CHLR|nr:universal stress protein [Chloroflexus islandicus]OAN46468.1 universal stress protein UspA [Chloroflexus islandicus]